MRRYSSVDMGGQLIIEDVPPSAKLVYTVLEHRGPMTQKELVERSMLAPRTVRDALGRLTDLGVVAEGIYIPDARQRLYALTGEPLHARRA